MLTFSGMILTFYKFGKRDFFKTEKLTNIHNRIGGQHQLLENRGITLSSLDSAMNMNSSLLNNKSTKICTPFIIY